MAIAAHMLQGFIGHLAQLLKHLQMEIPSSNGIQSSILGTCVTLMSIQQPSPFLHLFFSLVLISFDLLFQRTQQDQGILSYSDHIIQYNKHSSKQCIIFYSSLPSIYSDLPNQIYCLFDNNQLQLHSNEPNHNNSAKYSDKITDQLH